ncbi:phage tail protein [Halomonas cupida]|uniref:phage tail protein n=1 Tax=Halomonas cupida TaxID=44933 RepID=UPI003A8CC26A
MKKLHLLRKHLIAAVPAFARDPERLLTFVEDGSIEFHRGPNLSHEYAFTAQLVLTDFAGDLDTVMLPLLQWLAEYQPDVEPSEALSFEAEILSNDAVDLALRLRLTERVIAQVDCHSGRIESEHVTIRFERDTCPAAQWQLFTREPGEDDWNLTSEWTAHGG